MCMLPILKQDPRGHEGSKYPISITRDHRTTSLYIVKGYQLSQSRVGPLCWYFLLIVCCSVDGYWLETVSAKCCIVQASYTLNNIISTSTSQDQIINENGPVHLDIKNHRFFGWGKNGILWIICGNSQKNCRLIFTLPIHIFLWTSQAINLTEIMIHWKSKMSDHHFLGNHRISL